MLKPPVTISLLVLAIAGGLGWQLERSLADARQTQTQLAAKARELGLTGEPANPGRHAKPERESRANGTQLTADFLACVRDQATLIAGGGTPDATLRKRCAETIRQIRLLDAAQVPGLIARLYASDEASDGTCRDLVFRLLSDLAFDHPQTALKLLAETPQLLGTGAAASVISRALAGWAKDDPAAVLEWVKRNREALPALDTPDIKAAIIKGTAARDPALAFQLINDLGLQDSNVYAATILRAAGTPAERTAALAAYHEHSAAIADEKARKTVAGAVRYLADGIARDGFATASQWLATAALTPEERSDIALQLPSLINANERVRWIDWLGANLPAKQASEAIKSHVREWTNADPQAAGQWLVSVPAGPTRTAAIQSYATEVSRSDPAAATQWAMTLPPGPDRDQALRIIQRK